MADSFELTKAVNAYNNTSRMKPAGGLDSIGMPGEEDDALKPEFSDVLGAALDKARGAEYTGEAVSAEAIAGKAELHELVTAVTNAELTLQTVVAVRDRVITAYQDIVKMPI